MNRQTGKINLAKLKSIIRDYPGKAGNVKCIIIPIAENNLFEGQSGVYLDFVAFPFKNPKDDRKETHLIKQSFPREYLEDLTEDQRNKLPLIGNITEWTTASTPSDTIEASAEIPTDKPLPF